MSDITPQIDSPSSSPAPGGSGHDGNHGGENNSAIGKVINWGKQKLRINGEPLVNTAQDEESAKAKEARQELIPKSNDMTLASLGVTLAGDRRDEVIDLGGQKTFKETEKKHLRYGESINLDQELYNTVYDRLSIVQHWIDTNPNDPRIENLSTLVRVNMPEFIKWRNRAVAIAEGIETGVIGKDSKERIFHGFDVIRALSIVEQTNIIASHAMGYEMTAGGTRTLEFTLRNTVPSREIVTRMKDPGWVEKCAQGLHDALNVVDRDKRMKAIMHWMDVGAVAAGSAGAFMAYKTGDPQWFAIGGGAGLAIEGTGILLGNLRLDLSDKKALEKFTFSVSYVPNIPRGHRVRIAEDPLADAFLGRGSERASGGRIGEVQRLIEEGERVRQAIYKRLGIEDITDFDLHPANLSRAGGDPLDFHFRLRQNIQKIIESSYPDLPERPIAIGVAWRDFSGLTPTQRHEIMIRAYDLTAAEDVCSKEGKEILDEIIAGGKAAIDMRNDVATTLSARAKDIQEGKISLHPDQPSRTAEEVQVEIDAAAKSIEDVGKKKQDQEAAKRKYADALKHVQDKEKAASVKRTELEKTKKEKGKTGTPEVRNPTGVVIKTEKPGTGQIGRIEKEIKRLNKRLDTLKKEKGEFVPGTGFTGILAERVRLDTELGVATAHVKGANRDLERRKARHKELEDQFRANKGTLPPAEFAEFSALSNATHPQSVESAERDLKPLVRTQKELETQLAYVNKRLVDIDTFVDNIEKHGGEISGLEKQLDEAESTIANKEAEHKQAQEELRQAEKERDDMLKDLFGMDPTQAGFVPPSEAGIENIVKQTEKEIAELTEKKNKLTQEKTEVEAGTAKHQVSKEDKEIGEGIEAIAQVSDAGETGRFNKIIASILKGEYDVDKLTDRATSHNELLYIIFGHDALVETKMPFYRKILSEAYVTEQAFQFLDLAREDKANHFFHGDADGLVAYNESRANMQRMRTVQQRIRELSLTAGNTDMQNLNEQMRRLHEENIRLLHGIYDRHITRFLGEHRVTTAEFVRTLIDNMRENAFADDPFAGGETRLPERAGPHIGPDGQLEIDAPPLGSDRSAFTRGDINWDAPEDYSVNGERVKVDMHVGIDASGNLGTSVGMTLNNFAGLYAVLPDDSTRLHVGSEVDQYLRNEQIFDDIYDASSGHKRAHMNILLSHAVNVLPPLRPPDMSDETNADVQAIRRFLVKFHLDESKTIDRLYDSSSTLQTIEAVNIVQDALDSQNKDRQIRLESGNQAGVIALETWMNTGAELQLGETQQMFRAFARGITENTPRANRDLLGIRTRTVADSTGAFRTQYSNGNMELLVGGNYHNFSEIIQLSETRRLSLVPGLTNAIMNELLEKIGKGFIEVLRLRSRQM